MHLEQLLCTSKISYATSLDFVEFNSGANLLASDRDLHYQDPLTDLPCTPCAPTGTEPGLSLNPEALGLLQLQPQKFTLLRFPGVLISDVLWR